MGKDDFPVQTVRCEAQDNSGIGLSVGLVCALIRILEITHVARFIGNPRASGCCSMEMLVKYIILAWQCNSLICARRHGIPGAAEKQNQLSERGGRNEQRGETGRTRKRGWCWKPQLNCKQNTSYVAMPSDTVTTTSLSPEIFDFEIKQHDRKSWI